MQCFLANHRGKDSRDAGPEPNVLEQELPESHTAEKRQVLSNTGRFEFIGECD